MDTITFGLISEGVSEHNIIKHIIARFLEDDNCRIRQIQPEVDKRGKQIGYGGWLGVLNYCKEENFDNILSVNDYIVIQIDTDTSEQINYDVKKTKENNIPKNEEELYDDICKRLLKNISVEKRGEYDGKILFAICFNETECWLLPIYYTDDTKCSTSNCIYKLNQKIPLHVPDRDKNSPVAQRAYQEILKKLRNPEKIKACSEHNTGFRKFMAQLNKINN
ncbi:hypothetical protein EZS27_009404 [termite gut metagenome]|uniref:Uncharacterized protein n=1 Tax=termite gut metagenome TaxID=433724 RepID=A0A5J4S9V9_9ZZZZ